LQPKEKDSFEYSIKRELLLDFYIHLIRNFC